METQLMGEIRKLKSSRGGDPPRESTPRRLAAIVAGDIAGYSRLMQIDEEGTHLRVRRIERDLIEPSIVGHHGRLVKTTGDGFIAIFDSPVEAVRSGKGLPRASGSGRLQQDPKTARERSDFIAGPHVADHRKRRPLVFDFATAWQGKGSGVNPGFAGSAEDALSAATQLEASSAAASAAVTSSLASGSTRRPAITAASPVRVSRHIGHAAGLGDPRARDERDSRRQLHNG